MVKLNKFKILLITLCFSICSLKCATIGLVTDRYPEEFYKVPKLLSDDKIKTNSTFIVYSDNQAGWRVKEKFLKKSNWTDPKMFIFPFYELYLLGNGMIGGINMLRQAPDYGSQGRRLVRDAIYTEAKNSQAAFILNLGDITASDGRRPAHWKMFLKENKIEHPLLKEIPYLPVVGNHERANNITFGLSNYQAIFDYPQFYVVEFTDAVLIVIDSNYLIDQYGNLSDELQDELFNKWFVSGVDCKESSWLEKQLTAYNKTFKIIAMHHPLISYGKHHKDWSNSSWGKNLQTKRHNLLKLIEKYDVQLVLSGHDHLYQHIVLQHDSGKETYFLINGSGGTPLRDLTDSKTLRKYQKAFKENGLQCELINQGKIYQYSTIEINFEQVLVKVFKVTGKEESSTLFVEEIRIDKQK